MADRITIMNEGIIQQTGEPDQIYKAPTNTFIAGFMGSPPMNLLNARVAEEDGILDMGEIRLKVPAIKELKVSLSFISRWLPFH